MSDTQTPAPTVEEIQKSWNELTLKVAELQAGEAALEQQNKTLRQLLEMVIDQRQKSHSELVILLTNLVSRLPLNDVGGIIAQLLEHDTRVSEFLCGIGKGKTDTQIARPEILKSLDQVKRDLSGSLKSLVEELFRMDTPVEPELLRGLVDNPDCFQSPRMVRANRCYVKGQIPRERVLKEFGPEALGFFNDMTTDPKLNPRPKPDEILMSFRSDAESLLAQDTTLSPEKRQALLSLYQRIWKSRAQSDEGRAQRNTFQRLSFVVELLHYYEHQTTESPDVVFAQRLPALLEQIAITNLEDALRLDEKQVLQAESLLAHIISPNHRHAVINNLSKGSDAAKTLKFLLKFRSETVEELDYSTPEFIRHIIPGGGTKPPSVEVLVGLGKLLPPHSQRLLAMGIMNTDRLRKAEAESLAKALASELGLKSFEKKAADLPPEVEREIAWNKIKDQIARRAEPLAVVTAIRERLHAKYDADEIRQSWITLTEAEPILLIRVVCYLPYLPDGKTDPIARPVLETYVSRLMHEKYAATYKKVVRSLKNIFAAKADSPTLLNFLALVRWISPEAADKLSADIGMHAPAAH